MTLRCGWQTGLSYRRAPHAARGARRACPCLACVGAWQRTSFFARSCLTQSGHSLNAFSCLNFSNGRKPKLNSPFADALARNAFENRRGLPPDSRHRRPAAPSRRTCDRSTSDLRLLGDLEARHAHRRPDPTTTPLGACGRTRQVIERFCAPHEGADSLESIGNEQPPLL